MATPHSRIYSFTVSKFDLILYTVKRTDIILINTEVWLTIGDNSIHYLRILIKSRTFITLKTKTFVTNIGDQFSYI